MAAAHAVVKLALINGGASLRHPVVTPGGSIGGGTGVPPLEDRMTSANGQARPLIGFTIGGNAPPVVPAPTNRGWMSATRGGWANRCLPLLIANQSGWELRTPSAFTATWMGGDDLGSLMITPDRRDLVSFCRRAISATAF